MIPQLQRETPVDSTEDILQWSLATRIAFRFFFSYCVLYFYPIALGSRGGGGTIAEYHNPVRTFWNHVVPWVGTNILHLDGPIKETFNGSGDQVYDYVMWFCILAFAMMAAVIWSVLDRKRPNYTLLYNWLRVLVRLLLATTMISYGTNKLFRQQFPELPLAKLLDTYGRSSPEGLLWAFMDYSRVYSFFGGVGETIGGLLLFIPGLCTLGSLISLAVMSNVLMLNLCYDVSRKIFSIHIVVMFLFLLLPDLRRLAELFFLRRTIQLAPRESLFKDKVLDKCALLLQLVIGVMVIINCSHLAYLHAEQLARHVDPSIRGVWSVNDFVLDGISKPPLLTDTDRWQYVVFDAPDVLTIELMNGAQRKYSLALDNGGTTLKLSDPGLPDWNASINLEKRGSSKLVLNGHLGSRQLSVTASRVSLEDPSQFLLTNRGFNWSSPFVFSF